MVTSQEIVTGKFIRSGCFECQEGARTIAHLHALELHSIHTNSRAMIAGKRQEGTNMAGRMALFDVHCHLQDSRILHKAPELIRAARERGVQWMAVNGTSEEDWETVKKMGEEHERVIPCYGLHPWYVNERSDEWLTKLRFMLESDPTAAVGEVGLCQSKKGREVDAHLQVEVLRQQLRLARELHRPVAVHCVRSFGPLLELLKEIGHFPAGLIMHSYSGNQEQVKELGKYNAYFSFSGFATSMTRKRAQAVWRTVPVEKLVLETDCPDAFPSSSHLEGDSLAYVSDDPATPSQSKCRGEKDAKPTSCGALNQPANVTSLLIYVASILETPEEELAEKTFENSATLFSYPGTKLYLS